jgi:HAD superfamily hydrolase (TIGR01662 family)
MPKRVILPKKGFPNLSALKSAKGVLLDLDNTLYAYAPCHAYALRKCHALYAAKVGRIGFKTFSRLYLEARSSVKKNNRGTAGSRSRHLYFQSMLELELGHTSVALSLELGDMYWKSFLKKMKLRPWVKGFLKSAKEQGIRFVIVTNQESSLQFKKMLRLRIDRFIDFVVTSEEAGIEKPSSRIFRLALHKIGMNPSEVVMIGDDDLEDHKGATREKIPFVSCC